MINWIISVHWLKCENTEKCQHSISGVTSDCNLRNFLDLLLVFSSSRQGGHSIFNRLGEAWDFLRTAFLIMNSIRNTLSSKIIKMIPWLIQTWKSYNLTTNSCVNYCWTSCKYKPNVTHFLQFVLFREFLAICWHLRQFHEFVYKMREIYSFFQVNVILLKPWRIIKLSFSRCAHSLA